MKVTLTNNNQTLIGRRGENLLLLLRRKGVFVSADCGGHGKCGKCGVKITVNGNTQNVLACRYILNENCKVELPQFDDGCITQTPSLSPAVKPKCRLGVVLDVGTTTLAYRLINTDTGEVLDTAAELNNQKIYGADVLSRISACFNGKTDALQALVLRSVREKLLYYANRYGAISRLMVAGNATMLHLFCGINPSPLGVFPFTPVFTGIKKLKGRELSLPAEDVTLLPSVSAYVGADIVAGAVALNAARQNCLLVDIGTNGEIMAVKDGEIICASTAAGPAFEGASVSCGTGGIKGAVDSVRFVDGKINFTTIGGEAPTGICGAGLISAVALMRRLNIVEENGFMPSGNFEICENISLTQKDVREFQLAKSAIISGITVVTEKIGGIDALDSIYIAGGLGFYMNLNDAISTGLLPSAAEKKAIAAGNTALDGASKCLLSSSAVGEANLIASRARNIELSVLKEFTDSFVDNLFIKPNERI